MPADRITDVGLQAPLSGLAGGDASVDVAPSFDSQAFRKAMEDTRVWHSKAEVIELNDDTKDSDAEHILDVRVRLMPSDVELWAEWSLDYGGPDFGDWFEPEVGDHVLVALCAKHDGDNEEAIVTNRLWSKKHRKPQASATGKRLIIVRPGDSLEIQVSEDGGFLLDVNGDGNVEINCENQVNIIGAKDSKFEVTGVGGTLNLQGETVAAHDGGPRFAVVLVNELNTLITAINANIGIFAGHTHTETGGTTSSPLPPPMVTHGSASGASVLEAE